MVVMVMMMVVVPGAGLGGGGGQDVRGGVLLREEVGVHRRLVQGEGLDVCNGQSRREFDCSVLKAMARDYLA